MTVLTMTDDTVQFLLRPRRELAKRLDSLAKQFRRKSGNQVAVEILEQYADFYAQAEQARLDVLTHQRELISSAGGQVRKVPVVKANQDEEHTTRKRELPARSGVGAGRSRAKR